MLGIYLIKYKKCKKDGDTKYVELILSFYINLFQDTRGTIMLMNHDD